MLLPPLRLPARAGLLLALVSSPVAAFDVERMTLEELMELNVESASRKAEQVWRTPAAVYVLTAEEIRRARATSVPEALRLVPGVQVARVDANKWAVSIRGFNARAANKLLVLVDGRSIYDPLFSGVLWESFDPMLENIDRIEVIRGPGGALWGANAVNGVINIITKHTRDTQGGLAVIGGGDELTSTGGARYGWRIGRDQTARVHANFSNRDQGFRRGSDVADDAHVGSAGFRWDWHQNATDDVVVSGDIYDARAGEFRQPGDPLPAGAVDAQHHGGQLSLGWRRQLSATDLWDARIYYQRFAFDNANALRERRDVYHFELQRNQAVHPRHQLVWGASWRDTQDEITPGPVLSLTPAARRDQVRAAFVQDTIALVPQQWELTLGAKVERNDYTGTEWQPNARLAYTPSAQRLWWAAVSRAVRTPSRLESDVVLAGARLGAGFDAERLTAYELGHRWQPNARWVFDIAVFRHAYDDLLTLEPGAGLANRMRGDADGFELTTRWDPHQRVRLEANYSYLRLDLALDDDSADVTRPELTEGAAPRHQLALRSEWDLARDWEFDAIVRYVDELPAQQVPAYTALDLGIGWRLERGLDVSLVGQNLLDPHHPEQRSTQTTEVQRGVYAKLSWRF